MICNRYKLSLNQISSEYVKISKENNSHALSQAFVIDLKQLDQSLLICRSIRTCTQMLNFSFSLLFITSYFQTALFIIKHSSTHFNFRIDFDDASARAGKLAKSAVLAALEEEEREKRGQKPESIELSYVERCTQYCRFECICVPKRYFTFICIINLNFALVIRVAMLNKFTHQQRRHNV
ncbi:CLUMA_CG013389, isoform A [Clunio marinus]|uniref:CLUMA_CG013389, isoform A n=1 Tax=Clunio marinus TaxID=568069 RepID=A0A1J1IKN9_9DIPT|nr:CLUMA_CG013389, isoform A [Clunio marinus]